MQKGKRKINKFIWALNEEKYLKLFEVKKLRVSYKKARDTALKQGKSIDIRDWFMLELGLNTGLRVDEMTKIKGEALHIQEDQASLSVRKGKGDKPRTVTFGEKFKKDCNWYLKWKQSKGQDVSLDSYLLTTSKGKKLSKRALQKAFKRCLKKAGLPEHYSIHALRHTYGTFLLKASNYNLRLVQQQLGHSTVKVTEVYTSLINSDLKEAVERLYK